MLCPESFFLPFCSNLCVFFLFFFQASDAKAAAKRKAEEERISKLSPADQKKVTANLNTANPRCLLPNIGTGKRAEASDPQVAGQSGPKVIIY